MSSHKPRTVAAGVAAVSTQGEPMTIYQPLRRMLARAEPGHQFWMRHTTLTVGAPSGQTCECGGTLVAVKEAPRMQQRGSEAGNRWLNVCGDCGTETESEPFDVPELAVSQHFVNPKQIRDPSLTGV